MAHNEHDERPDMPSKLVDQTKAKGRDAGPSGAEETHAGAATPGESARGASDVFPVVGIGTSAGGLKALETFFGNLPDSPAMAFVVVQHLDPERKSLMAELLGRHTSLKVIQADDGLALEPGTVYTLPPDKDLLLHGGVLALAPREKTRLGHMVIDRFFRSLAEDMGPRAVGIVLTGAGSDGSQGIKEIKAAGGMVMVQDEAQAEYASMPASAIATGQADFILPLEQIPRELLRYLEHPYMEPGTDEAEPLPTNDEQIMRRILLKVRRITGHDFAGYKRNTVLRRIERRMALQRVDSLGDYLNLLNQSPDEVQRLFMDLIILVTNFFRDPSAFEALKHKAIVPLLQERKDAELLRIWVPGCATGEEAYSVAMLFLEAMDELGLYTRLKIFGTDINPQALKAAREGVYPKNISADVSEDRLARFFDKCGEGYAVKDKLREMMVFAAHDLTRDPPFSRLDLVSCRNLLIYMDSDLQKRIIPIFHYCLAPGGYLFLGTSEGVGEFANLFAPVQKKWKIFRARDSGRIMRESKQRLPKEPYLTPITHEHATSRRESPQKGQGGHPEERPSEQAQAGEPGKLDRHGHDSPAAQAMAAEFAGLRREDYRQLMEKTLLEQATAVVLLDGRNDCLFFHGDTDKFLAPPIGAASLNIMAMARPSLRDKLQEGLAKVRADGRAWRGDDLLAHHLGGAQLAAVRVIPVPQSESGNLLVVFEDKGQADGDTVPAASEADARVSELLRELHSVRQDLQATIEELETSNEELKSANEELKSANEEQQANNEELQSANEELEGVNAQLQHKNEELSKANNDIRNLFAASDAGALFLDEELRIKRFTPAIRAVFNLKEERDIGRPITDIASRLAYDGLEQDASQVLDTLGIRETEVQTKDGRWFLMRVRPYRTMDNFIEGVVMSFADISGLKQALLAERQARMLAEAVMETIREPLLVLDFDLRVLSANPAFYRFFKTRHEETEGQLLYELGDYQWNLAPLRKLLEEIIPGNAQFQGFCVEADFPRIGRRAMLLNARRIDQEDGRPRMILLAFDDVTDKPIAPDVETRP